MSIEIFEYHAGSGIGHHKEEEGLMLIGAYLDSSVKFIFAPKGLKGIKKGTKLNIKKVGRTNCGCGKVHQCLILEERIDGKELIVYECSEQYIFGAR